LCFTYKAKGVPGIGKTYVPNNTSEKKCVQQKWWVCSFVLREEVCRRHFGQIKVPGIIMGEVALLPLMVDAAGGGGGGGEAGESGTSARGSPVRIHTFL
jgi:hypothetical protein